MKWFYVTALCILLSGCGSGGGGTPGQPQAIDTEKVLPELEGFLKTSLNRPDNPTEFSKARIERTTPVSDELTRIEFAIDGEQLRDVFIELQRDKVFAKAGFNVDAIAEARKRLLKLPEFDTIALEKQIPSPDSFGRLVRCDARTGDKRTLKGHCTARQRENGWQFEHLTVTDDGRKPGDTSNDANEARLPVVPDGGVDIDSPQGKARLENAAAEAKKFLDGVAALEKTVQERDETQFAALKDAALPGRLWNITAPNQSGRNTEWIIEFVDCDQKVDPDAIRAVVRNPNDLLDRAVYDGKVYRASVVEPDRISRPIRQPPRLTFNRQPGGPSVIFLPPSGEPAVIRFNNKGEYLNLQIGVHESAVLARSEGSKAQTDPEAWDRLLERVKPGTQWTGIVNTPRFGNINILFTITEAKPDGSYLRAIVETPSDPVAVVCLEGSCRKDQLHSSPLTFTASSGLRMDKTRGDLFEYNPAFAKVPLALSVTEKGFAGRMGNDSVELTASTMVKTDEDRATKTKKAFAAGARFKGPIISETNEDLGEAVLTVAEVRDNGYVRVLAYHVNTPYETISFDGKLNTEPGFVDGYCLELRKRALGWHRTKTLFNEDVDPVALQLRLSSDGVNCVAAVVTERVRVAEWVKLTRIADAPKSRPLATQEAAADVRSKLAFSAVWRGEFKSKEHNKSGKVSMRVLKATGDGLTLEFTSVDLVGGRVVYDGLLNLQDATVNGSFAVLQKTTGGKIPASQARQPLGALRQMVSFFDSETGSSRKLYLSLSDDGETLYGFSGHLDFGDHDTCEVMSLKRVSLPKPTGTAPAPGAAPTSATNASGVSEPASSVVRTWKSSDGKFTIDAELVTSADGKVTLRGADGKTIDVPLDRLSKEDQDFIAQQTKK